MKKSYQEIQYRVHQTLNGSGQLGLNWIQILNASVIVASVFFAIIVTENVVSVWLGNFLEIIEIGFASFFVIEYFVRLWAAGTTPIYAGVYGRVRYALTPLALLDLISILPYFIGWGSQSFIIRMLRLFRLLALSRLIRYSTAMRLVLQSIYDRRHELLFAISLACCIILISAAALYSVEADIQPEAFGSIPRALWWSVSTLTTVGYGDVVPMTPLGKFFAALTAIAGIGLIAMPTGILAAVFSEAFRKKH